MKLTAENKNALLKCSLFVIPLVLTIILLIERIIVYRFFLWNHDPSYAYLLNGLNIANGSFDLELTGHPGTPLEMLVAVVIWIVYFFIGNGDITTHVLNNPEIYLTVTSCVLIFLHALCNFFLGWLYYRLTGNIKIAWMLQLIPFVSSTALKFMPMVMTESLYVLPLLMLIFLCLFYIERQNYKPNLIIVLFAVCGGMMIATKISNFFVLLFPFVLLKGMSNKIKYIIGILISFFLFTIPIVSKYGNFIHWMNNLLTHTETYGGGREGIIDINLFFSNLKSMFVFDWLFTVSVIFLFGFQLFFLFNRGKYKKTIYFKGFSIINTIIFIQILVVAKHYSFHYMLPVQLLLIPGFILLYKHLVMTNQFKISGFTIFKKYKMLIPIILFMVLILHFFTRNPYPPKLFDAGRISLEYVEKELKDDPVIIELPFRKAIPFKQVGLYFGTCYTGGVKNEYFSRLIDKYPNTYFYETGQNRLYSWNGDISFMTIFNKHSNIIYYFNGSDSTKGKLLNNELFEENKMLFYNELTKDYFYKLIIDTGYVNNFYHYRILCDMENRTEDSSMFVTNITNEFFTNGYMQNRNESFSGQFSANFGKERYGPLYKMKVNNGDQITATFHQYPSDVNGILVASHRNSSLFFKANGSGCSDSKNKNWKKLELNFTVPLVLDDSTIIIYALSKYNKPLFIDDFEINQWKRK